MYLHLSQVWKHSIQKIETFQKKVFDEIEKLFVCLYFQPLLHLSFHMSHILLALTIKQRYF